MSSRLKTPECRWDAIDLPSRSFRHLWKTHDAQATEEKCERCGLIRQLSLVDKGRVAVGYRREGEGYS